MAMHCINCYITDHLLNGFSSHRNWELKKHYQFPNYTASLLWQNCLSTCLSSRPVSRYVYLNQEVNTYICRKEILRTESKKDAIIWWQHIHDICTCCSNRIYRWQSCMMVNSHFLWFLLHQSWSHWLDTVKQQSNVVSQEASVLLGYDAVLQCGSRPCRGE